MESETTKDQAIRELIDAVLKRPEMYVGECRLHTVTCYLSGFSLGLRLGPAGVEDVPDEWNDFTTWLYRKLDAPADLGPFRLLHHACSSEKAALAKLASYWSEYQSSRRQAVGQDEWHRGESTRD
jgi:hypothetical protein